MHSFHRNFGRIIRNSTKRCISTNFPHQKIRRNFVTLPSVVFYHLIISLIEIKDSKLHILICIFRTADFLLLAKVRFLFLKRRLFDQKLNAEV